MLILLFVGNLFATTWAPSELTDPLSNEKVPSQDVMSYGSYIYDWPSKYDLVFWPYTAERWITLNPKNGYAAFNSDFENLKNNEKDRLSRWLAENYELSKAVKSHIEKLEWIEKIYSNRNMDDDFWGRFYRLMAFKQEDQEKSLIYVEKAMVLLKKKLDEKPRGIDAIQVYYLVGEYSRRLGDKEAAILYFEKVKNTKYKDKDGEEKKGHPYFVSLVEDREKLINGQKGEFNKNN